MICPHCGEVITRRSDDISTRFHGWITWMTRNLNGQKSRPQVYYEVLLKAVEIEADGGDPYPYDMIERIVESPITGKKQAVLMVEPWSTTKATNKQMMNACFACELYATEHDIGPLPERINGFI